MACPYLYIYIYIYLLIKLKTCASIVVSTVADLLKHKISKVSITVCANIRWKYMLWHAARCTDNGHNIKDSIGMHENSITSAIIFFFITQVIEPVVWHTLKIVHFEKHWIWDQINIKIPIGHGSNVKLSDTICSY